jgi:hypothetical protein
MDETQVRKDLFELTQKILCDLCVFARVTFA